MTKITDAIKKLESNPNANKILDSLLAKGVVTVGNQNDYINCITKCYPNATSDQVNSIFEQLEQQLEEGTVCNYYLLDEKDDDAILSVPLVENLFLNFYVIEANE